MALDVTADPLVSVVVLSWNGGAFLFDCISSVLHQSYSRIELIVVDNGSTDGTSRQLAERLPSSVTILLNGSNLGFAKGMNVGIAASKGEYVLCLNQDVVLEDTFIERCVNRTR